MFIDATATVNGIGRSPEFELVTVEVVLPNDGVVAVNGLNAELAVRPTANHDSNITNRDLLVGEMRIVRVDRILVVRQSNYFDCVKELQIVGLFGQWLVQITLPITGRRRTNCKKTGKLTTAAPVHRMVIRIGLYRGKPCGSADEQSNRNKCWQGRRAPATEKQIQPKRN